jgi:leucyl aminopeptidase
MTALAERFDAIGSWRKPVMVVVAGGVEAAHDGEALGLPVAGDLPSSLGVSTSALAAAGFAGRVGETLVLPSGEGSLRLAYGIGDAAELTANQARDAAAAVARAALRAERIGLVVPKSAVDTGAAMAQAVVEGAILARYQYVGLRHEMSQPPLRQLTLYCGPAERAAVEQGARRGLLYARATMMARDLANSPPSLLNAERMAETARQVAGECGLQVEIFDDEALRRLGCGGLLGVNAGSADPARMIKLRYVPAGAGADVAHLALIGKGIMYDSGGIALKPTDAVHATMKNDMSGAGAILAAMAILRDLGCPVAVTGYLMCTDNMPSGSATKLGDVLSIRGGTTVEVVNTDAEGRLVMADAIVLATEDAVDAIVDIATLTGACLRALGAEIAGVFGNNHSLVNLVLSCADEVDEPCWQLPLAHRYRKEMNSDVADIKNMGGPNAAAIHAALFLEEFVAGTPWAHIDIAGTAQSEAAAGWRTPGCTGFGARLLAQLASTFTTPKK